MSEPTFPDTSLVDSTRCDPKTQPCPASCPPDFTITAPCRIIKADGGSVQISASEIEPGYSPGTYAWTSPSTKIRLVNPNASIVTVEGLAAPSAGRDAEVITVTRTAAGCPPIVKTVNVTVAKVTFSQSASQRYGYDNMDTPASTLDDHICVKKSDHTFLHVDIEGGTVGTDFNFVCDNPAICAPVAPGGAASFDLRLNAGDHTKANTTLHAKCRCAAATSFTHIAVHVYKEKVAEVVVAKIYDSTQAGTNLRFPNADYAGETGTINGKAKEAVVKYDISNYDARNAQTDVRYDLDNNGVLSYDIKNAGGRELDAIKAAMTGTGRKVRVAIIRDMKSFYYLSAGAAAGDREITVTSGHVYETRTTLQLGTGASKEAVTIASIAGSTIRLNAPLAHDHASGEPLEYSAAGWSTDPILVTESSAAFDTLKWTIPHEAGHRSLSLDDVDDLTSIMHYSRDRTDYRLRYCPRTKFRGGGTENQWETIPR